jgi:hypothetical protein
MEAVLKYSIVVPLHNEQENVTDLYARLKSVMEASGETFEMVLVDDGSIDGTFSLLKEIAAVDSRVTVVKLRRNFGQTAGLAAGFDHARGEYIIAMDGDLQHDPADIPLFLEKIAEGYDIVSGWRKNRVDNFWMRRIPSRCANWLMAKLSGVDIHDFGTTFKSYRREILGPSSALWRVASLHSGLASWYGASIIEVPIKNIEPGARRLALWHLANLPRLLRPDHHPLPAQIPFAPAALFRHARDVQHFRWQRNFGLADSRKDTAPLRCHVPARPADDVLRGTSACRTELASRRSARGDASPPLPRTHPARSLLDRSSAASAKRREHNLGVALPAQV